MHRWVRSSAAASRRSIVGRDRSSRRGEPRARAGDLDDLLALRNDPGVNRFMIRTRVEPETFRQEWLAVPESESDFSCVAELDGQVVAMGFLELEDGTGRPGMPRLTEAGVGYIVDPAHAGRGVASDLARGLLTAAFDHLGVRRVTAGCNADNPASARVLEKVGMRREQHGIEDSWHAELGWVDGCTCAVLAREWHAAGQAPTRSQAVTPTPSSTRANAATVSSQERASA